MKVLFLSPVGTIGGAERWLIDAVRSLRQSTPVEPMALCCDEGPLPQALRALGVEAKVVQMPASLASLGDSALREASGRVGAAFTLARRGVESSVDALRFARRLGEAVKELRPALVHSNGMKTHLFSALAPLEVPRVFHLQDFPSERPVMAQALRFALKRAATTIAISRAVGEDVRRTYGPVPLEVVYNAVDTERFSPGPQDFTKLDAQAGWTTPPPPNTLRIGFVATYARWKGHGVFLEAAARLTADRPDAELRFYIVGGPVYRTAGSQVTRDELAAHAAALGLEGRVALLPFTDDPASVYRALDVVVHASTRPEPFGLTIVEAMACGRPVVVSAAGGARELFTDGVDALGFPSGRPDALAARLGTLVESSSARSALAAAARRTAENRFSHVRLGPELHAVYRQVLRQR